MVKEIKKFSDTEILKQSFTTYNVLFTSLLQI